MDTFNFFTHSDDESRLVLSQRGAAVLISVICLISCLTDFLFNHSTLIPPCEMKDHLDSFKYVLQALFKIANVLLLVGSIVETPLLLQIYLWYMLGYVIMGFVAMILDFCFRINNEGKSSFLTFIPDVIFLFVIFRCLQLVDDYKKHLENF